MYFFIEIFTVRIYFKKAALKGKHVYCCSFNICVYFSKKNIALEVISLLD